jgi:transposase-like protein
MLEIMPKDTEVSAKPKRRTFTAEYRLRIVKEADACTQSGEVGALLRREGLYSSHLTEWRRAARSGELSALTPKKRGPKRSFDEQNDKLIAMAREIEKLRARAERAELLVEIQKKVASAIGIPFDDESDEKR